MPNRDKPADVFMQFADLVGVWPGNTTAVSEVKMQTGLSVRGGLMWLIHKVSLLMRGHAIGYSQFSAALTTVPELGAVPFYGDKGTIEAWLSALAGAPSAGLAQDPFPRSSHFLPPLPLAAPSLSFYFATADDDSYLDTSQIGVRIGYTTAPLDAKSYAEIAEAWAYV